MRALCTPRPALTSIPALPRLPTNPGWSSVSCVSDQRSAPAGTQRQVTTISLAGFASAVIFFCLSLTPSLLPRDWLLQGLLSGVLAAIAYGIGVFIGFGARKVLPRVRSVAIDRLAWRAVALGSVVLVALFLYLGSAWQHEIRRLVGESQPTRYRYVLILLVAVALSAILVAIARLLRRLTRWVDQRLDRWLPIGVADVLGALVVALLVFGFIHGVVYDTLIAAANHAFKIINAETVPGDLPPVAPERSGSPASLVSWASLGNKGRDYIAGGPTPDQLQAFSGEPGQRPIRVYVGLESAPTLDTEAALAVRELQRVNGFSRTVLCVVTTTGTGHIDPNAVDALEYMYDGHTAIVSMQYSYLPSWISFLVDRRRAEEAGVNSSTRCMPSGLNCRARPGQSSWCSGKVWGRSVARPRSAGLTTSGTAPTGCCGKDRLTTALSGGSSSGSAIPERRRSSRSIRRESPYDSALVRRTWSARPAPGRYRGSFTSSMPPTPWSGGPGGWCCTTPTGSRSPAARTCSPRCAGTLS